MRTGIPLWAMMLTAILLGTALTGCGGGMLRGRWQMVRAIPNRDTFAIDDAVFNKDGTYEATVTIEGHTRHETGRYAFKRLRLYLMPTGGGQRVYNTTRSLRTLQIMKGDRKVILEKAP